MAVEGSEEALTEVANIVYDTLTMGELSNYELAVKNYISKGLPETEARARATTELFTQIGLAGLGGMLMGGASGSFASGMGYISGRKTLDEVNKQKPTSAASPTVQAAQPEAQMPISPVAGNDTVAHETSQRRANRSPYSRLSPLRR